MTSKNTHQNIFMKMHPLHRIGVSFILVLVAFFILPKERMDGLLIAMTLWVVFAGAYLAMSWIVLSKRSVEEIRKAAVDDDGSIVVVFIMILISSFASMFTVLLLMISTGQKDSGNNIADLLISVAGMMTSWFMIHTIFTFHYAHMFYDDAKESDKKAAEGLEFPGKDKPDYIDFAYFSFVIGCTFQVSDVEITSRKIRRLVLLHSLLAFGLNTFVVALTINMVAGLS